MGNARSFTLLSILLLALFLFSESIALAMGSSAPSEKQATAASPAGVQTCSCRVTVGTQNRALWGSWALECAGHAGHGDCPTTNEDIFHSPGAGALVGTVQIDARSDGQTRSTWKTDIGDDHVTAFKGPAWIENGWEWSNVCSCDAYNHDQGQWTDGQWWDPNAAMYSGAEVSPEYITQGTSNFLTMDYACGDPRGQIVVMERMQEHDPWFGEDDPLGQIAIGFKPQEGVNNVTMWGEHFEPAYINGQRTHAGYAGGSYGADIVMTTECYTSGTPPAPVNPGSNNYQGCYTDDESRALPNYLGSDQTVESCIQLAQANGFAFAGLQFYGQCFGGNTAGYTRTSESDCNTPCSQNGGEICGGSWRNSVYAVPAPTPPAGQYQGCYTDDENRALPVLLGGGFTPSSCIVAAQGAGYKYAGVQWYGQCFAGNSVGYSRVGEEECNTPCDANPVEMCGGGWRNNIYATGL